MTNTSNTNTPDTSSQPSEPQKVEKVNETPAVTKTEGLIARFDGKGKLNTANFKKD